MPLEEAQLPFRTVRDQHRQAQGQGLFTDLDLAQYSKLLGEQTGSGRYRGGESSGIGLKVKQGSAWLDDMLDKTPLPEMGADFGGWMSEKLFDDEELGRHIGRTLPRQALNMLPLLTPLGWGGLAAKGALTVGKYALTSGLMGGHVYEQTGEKDRAAIAAATGLVAPTVIGKAAKSAGNAVFNATGSKLLGRAATIPASVAGGSVVSVGSQTADIAAAPSRQFSELVSKEFWQTEAIASMAFLPLDIKQAFGAQIGRPTGGAEDAANQLRQDESVKNDVYVGHEEETRFLPPEEGPLQMDAVYLAKEGPLSPEFIYDTLPTPGRFPTDSTLFGRPYPAEYQPEHLTADPFTHQVKEIIGEGREMRPAKPPVESEGETVKPPVILEEFAPPAAPAKIGPESRQAGQEVLNKLEDGIYEIYDVGTNQVGRLSVDANPDGTKSGRWVYDTGEGNVGSDPASLVPWLDSSGKVNPHAQGARIGKRLEGQTTLKGDPGMLKGGKAEEGAIPRIPSEDVDPILLAQQREKPLGPAHPLQETIVKPPAKRPETQAEWESHIEITNESRNLLGLPRVDDAMLRRNVERQLEKGTPVDESLHRTLERLKYETDQERIRMEESGDYSKLPGDDDYRALVVRLNTVERLQPNMSPLIKSAKLQLAKHPDDIILREAIEGELVEFAGRLERDGAGGTDTSRRAFIAANRAAQARVKAAEKLAAGEEQKPGPAPRELDYNEIFTRVKALGDEAETMVHEVFIKYSTIISNKDANADVTRIVMNEVDKWLKFPDNLTRTQLEINMKRAVKLAEFQAQRIAAKERTAMEAEGYHDHETSGQVKEDASDASEAYFDEGGHLMRLTRQNRVKNNFILGLDKVIKRNEHGNLVIGGAHRALPRNGMIKAELLDTWMAKSSVGKSMWAAFKVAYPELFANVFDKNKLVDVKAIVSKINDGDFIRIEVDGAVKGSESSRMEQEWAQARHELETKGFDFREEYGEGSVFYKGTEIELSSFDPGSHTNPFSRDLGKQLIDYIDLTVRKGHREHNQNFAEQFGFVAPDEFVPFNPETGLGNTAVRVNLRGQSEYNHTDNPSNIGWVRGKFIDVDGERVYRIDEVQSDAAQSNRKQTERAQEDRARFQKEIEVLNNELSANRKLLDSLDPKQDSFQQYELKQTIARIEGRIEGKENLIRTYIDPKGNPLMPEAQSIALRAGILHAIQNGAKKVFLPDGNTAMMTEGHDRVNSVIPGEYKISTGLLKVDETGTNGVLHEPNGLTKDVKVGVNPFEFDQVPSYAKQPAQSKGMNLNYNQVLPNGAAKLLGVRGEYVNLGRHKDSPIAGTYYLKDFGTTKAAEEFLDGHSEPAYGMNRGSWVVLEADVAYSPKGFREVEQPPWFNSPEAHSNVRTPVLLDHLGKPQTSVTGRTFDLTAARQKMEADGGMPAVGREVGFEAMLTLQNRRQAEADHFLRKSGMSEEEATANSETVRNIANAFEQATGQKLTLRELVDAQNRGVAGVSMRSAVGREVALSNKVDADVAPLVAAHEIFGHQFQKSYELGQLSKSQRKNYEHLLKHWEETTVTERQTLMESFAKDVMGKDAWAKVKEEVFKTAGNEEESMANLMGLIATQAIKGKNPYDTLRFLPQPIADFAISGMQLLKDILNVAKTMIGFDTLRGSGSRANWQAIRKVQGQITKNFLAAQRAESRAKAELGPLENFMRGTELDISDRGIKGNSLEGAAAQLMNVKGVVGRVVDFLDPLMARGLRHPVLQETFIAARLESENAGIIQAGKELRLFGSRKTEGGRIVVERDMGALGRIERDSMTAHRLDELMLAIQVKGGSWEDYKFNSPAEYKAITEGFSGKQLSDFESALTLMKADTIAEQALIIDSNNKVGVIRFATFLREIHPELKGSNKEVLEQARVLYKEYNIARNENKFARVFTKATRENLKDPNLWNLENVIQERIGHTKFYADAVAAGVKLELAIRFLEPTQNAIASKKAIHEANPNYINESRTLQYAISYNTNKGNANGRHSVATIEEAVAFVAEIRKKGYKVFYPDTGYLNTWKKYGSTNKGQADFDSMLDAAENRTLHTTLEQMKNQEIISEATFDILTASNKSARAEFSAERMNLVLGSESPHRKFTDGREKLNMVNQMLRYGGAISKLLPRQETDAMLDFTRKDPALNDPRDLHMFEELEAGISHYRTPDSPVGKFVSTASFVQYMALNVSSGMIEASQFPLTLSPMLTRHGMSMTESYIAPIAAIGKITQHDATGKWSSGWKVKQGKGSKDLYQDMFDRIPTGMGQRQEVQESRVATQLNVARMAAGKSPLSRQNIAKSSLQGLLNVATRFYSAFTGFNERIGMISFLDLVLARDYAGRKNKVLSAEEWEHALNEAVHLSKTTNSSLGRVGRPVGFFDNKGTWRSAAHSAWALNSFNAGFLSHTFAHVRMGFGKDNIQGFTKADRSNAKKASIQAFATLVSAAGVIGGIPFMGGVNKTLQEHSEIDLEKEMRLFFHKLGGEEHGHFMADWATHGVFYAAGLPIDVSPRVALGGVPGINTYEGISPKALLGPAAGIVSDYAKAGEDVLRGDIGAALEDGLPLGLRKAYVNWRNDGIYRDTTGKKRFQLTSSEQVAQSLGFTPARISQFQEQSRMLRNADLRQGKRNQVVYKEVARVEREQGSAAANARLDEFVQRGDILNKTAGLNGVIRILNQERYGKDLREGGSLGTSLEATGINETFRDRGLPQVTAQERVMANFRNKMSMGQVSDPMRAFENSFVADAIWKQNPNLPFATAKFLAGQLTRPTHQNFGTSQELQQELLPFGF